MSVKRNSFGDAYCLTVSEARSEIENHENGWEVHLGDVDPPEPPRFGATAEVRDNTTGDLVCYLEAPTEDGVKAMAKELKIEAPDL